jgi:PIN domain nuclease of toxin-antitoxin system
LSVLLLDTHVWVWNVEGDARLGRRSRARLARAEAQHQIYISTASIFEVAALHTAGRLRVARPLEHWVQQSVEVSRARLVAISTAIAIDAGLIPRDALADPLDRLLAATARHLMATLLTGDARILEYAARTGDVHVTDARR